MKLISAILAATIMTANAEQAHAAEEGKPVRYAVVGDSYSIGEGATERESWPALLARHLTKSLRPVELVSNPARTGWTTQDAIEHELPLFRAARPDFATLMIGVNDWVQAVDEGTFRQRLGHLLDEMLKVLPNEKRLLVINIPDFSVTPDGPNYARGRDISAGLAEFQSHYEGRSAEARLARGRYLSPQPKDARASGADCRRRFASFRENLRPVGRADFSRGPRAVGEIGGSSGRSQEIAAAGGIAKPSIRSLISWTKLAAPAPFTTR